MAEETERLRQQVEEGVLSEEALQKNIDDMENTLAGLKNGSLIAARVVDADGQESVFVGTTPDPISIRKD